MASQFFALLALVSQSPCTEQYVAQGAEHLTLQQVRQLCQIDEPPLAKQKQHIEDQISLNRYALIAHRNNYILPVSYRPDIQSYGDIPPKDWEIKFQISLKAPISPALFDGRGRFYFAYTNQSWWQAYSTSAPLRESNHMPELFFSYRPNYQLGDWDVTSLHLGINHQSNGHSGDHSRSWDRMTVGSSISHGPWALSAQLWSRLSEGKKKPLDAIARGEDPQITDYLGYGELIALYEKQDHNLSLLLKGNPATRKGGVESGWSFPLSARVRGYVQLYYGYGEALIDYNVKSERISLGFELTPWL